MEIGEKGGSERRGGRRSNKWRGEIDGMESRCGINRRRGEEGDRQMEREKINQGK